MSDEESQMSSAKSQFLDFLGEFLGESDRAAVILGAAKIDIILHQILKKVLLPSPRSDDELLDPERPLSSFSAKIHILYRLGVIDAKVARLLHLIRKIRNDFAHEVANSKLDSGAHIDRTRELTSPFKKNSMFINGCEASRHRENLSSVSLEFRVVIGMLVASLENFFEDYPQITPDIHFSFEYLVED